MVKKLSINLQFIHIHLNSSVVYVIDLYFAIECKLRDYDNFSRTRVTAYVIPNNNYTRCCSRAAYLRCTG